MGFSIACVLLKSTSRNKLLSPSSLKGQIPLGDKARNVLGTDTEERRSLLIVIPLLRGYSFHRSTFGGAIHTGCRIVVGSGRRLESLTKFVRGFPSRRRLYSSRNEAEVNEIVPKLGGCLKSIRNVAIV